MPGRVTALVFFFFGRMMVLPKKGNVLKKIKKINRRDT